MRDAGWGKPPDHEGFSERDPAFRPARRGDERLPLGALLIAVTGIAVGTVGSLFSNGSARFDLTLEEGLARAGFGFAVLAGLWISFGRRDRAPGARLAGLFVIAIALLLAVATS